MFKKLLYKCITISNLMLVSTTAVIPTEKCLLEDSTCLKVQANKLSKHFLEGIPELGIDGLNKILLGTIELRKNGLIKIDKNAELEGLSDAVIEHLSVNKDSKTMTLSFQSSLIINFDYKSEGEFFKVPVFGDGKATEKLNNIIIEMVMLYDIKKNKDGNDYMDLTNYEYSYDVLGNITYYFGNAYNNDKEKSEKLHKFLNENWRTIYMNYGVIHIKKTTDIIFKAIKIYFAKNNLSDLVKY